MKVSDLRELTDDELARKLDESRQELFNLRFQHATGALENPAALTRAKRDIAASSRSPTNGRRPRVQTS